MSRKQNLPRKHVGNLHSCSDLIMKIQRSEFITTLVTVPKLVKIPETCNLKVNSLRSVYFKQQFLTNLGTWQKKNELVTIAMNSVKGMLFCCRRNHSNSLLVFDHACSFNSFP